MSLDTHIVLWILVVEVVDFIVGRIEWWLEYQFDKRLYEKKKGRIKKTKDKVRIVVEDGKASILEKPDDIDIAIEHKS